LKAFLILLLSIHVLGAPACVVFSSVVCLLTDVAFAPLPSFVALALSSLVLFFSLGVSEAFEFRSAAGAGFPLSQNCSTG
jgi:hypothetical protein